MPNKQASILIVDDDQHVRKVLLMALGCHFLCLTASSAEEANEILSVSPFDLVLSDINMPGASGLEFCKTAQRRWPETIVVIISGQTDIGSAIEAMRHGAFDYVVKPFDLDQLKVAVDRALRYQELLVARRDREYSLETKVRERTSELRSLNDTLNQTLEALYNSYRATLQALDEALEARDCETRGHSGRVVAYCLRLGKEMGLEHNDLIALEQGAMLHDIGKIGVRDSILLKPGPLTKDEWVEMREHINHGLKIIERIDFLSGARPVVSQHHEKFDGRGYPMGLHGDQIHRNARIFAVADAFDAITSDRPYRAGVSYTMARTEIISNSGSHFDPKVVAAFLVIDEAEWADIRRTAGKSAYVEQVMDKQEIRAFIISLKAPGKMRRPAHVA